MSEVKANKFSPSSGTAITLGDSGDTFTVTSGATLDLSSGTVTSNDTMKNVPAVLATSSSDQSISNSSHTQVTLDTETIDTDSAFASNTFTVPSGKGGMYFISFRGSMQGIDSGEFIQLRGYVNGSASNFFENRLTSHATDTEFKFSGSAAVNLSAGDTFKFYVFQNSGDAQNLSSAGLFIFKMVGV